MQSQFSFMQPTGEEARKRADRLFFALLPPPEAADRLAAFAPRFLDAHHLGGGRFDWRLLNAARLHISLQMVRNDRRLREKFVFAARQAARMVASSRVDMTLDTIRSFEAAPTRRHKRPLVLCGRGTGERDLFLALGTAMRRNGLRAKDDFKPHLTLAYGPCLVPEQPVDPVRVSLGEFVLIHSEVGLSRYHVLDRWPLNR